MSDLKPRWHPVLLNQEYFDYLRSEYPDRSHMSNNELEDEFDLNSKYVTMWDHAGDAYNDYEPLADAYLELLNNRPDGWISVKDRLLDKLKEFETPGIKWICRMSSTNRGLRLHQSSIGKYDTPQEAIEAWISPPNKSEDS